MAGVDPIQPWEDDPLLQYFEDPDIPSRVHVDARTKKSKAVNKELENMQGGAVGIYDAYRTGTKTQQKRAAKRIKQAMKMAETPKKIKKAGGGMTGVGLYPAEMARAGTMSQAKRKRYMKKGGGITYKMTGGQVVSHGYDK